MKKQLLTCIMLLTLLGSYAQTKKEVISLNEYTIVKDSSGRIYEFDVWQNYYKPEITPSGRLIGMLAPHT
jgi:hypothetical protein